MNTEYRKIIVKLLALALVCLFFIDAVQVADSLADAGSDRSALAPPLASKPPCEIKYDEDRKEYYVESYGGGERNYGRETYGTEKKELAKIEEYLAAHPGKTRDEAGREVLGSRIPGAAFRNRWVFMDISFLIGQMLDIQSKLPEKEKLKNPKDILIGLIHAHIKNQDAYGEIFIEGYDIGGMKELRENGEVTGFELPVKRTGGAGYSLAYSLNGKVPVIVLGNGTNIYIEKMMDSIVQDPGLTGQRNSPEHSWMKDDDRQLYEQFTAILGKIPAFLRDQTDPEKMLTDFKILETNRGLAVLLTAFLDLAANLGRDDLLWTKNLNGAISILIERLPRKMLRTKNGRRFMKFITDRSLGRRYSSGEEYFDKQGTHKFLDALYALIKKFGKDFMKTEEGAEFCGTLALKISETDIEKRILEYGAIPDMLKEGLIDIGPVAQAVDYITKMPDRWPEKNQLSAPAAILASYLAEKSPKYREAGAWLEPLVTARLLDYFRGSSKAQDEHVRWSLLRDALAHIEREYPLDIAGKIRIFQMTEDGMKFDHDSKEMLRYVEILPDDGGIDFIGGEKNLFRNAVFRDVKFTKLYIPASIVEGLTIKELASLIYYHLILLTMEKSGVTISQSEETFALNFAEKVCKAQDVGKVLLAVQRKIQSDDRRKFTLGLVADPRSGGLIDTPELSDRYDSILEASKKKYYDEFTGNPMPMISMPRVALAEMGSGIRPFLLYHGSFAGFMKLALKNEGYLGGKAGKGEGYNGVFSSASYTLAQGWAKGEIERDEQVETEMSMEWPPDNYTLTFSQMENILKKDGINEIGDRVVLRVRGERAYARTHNGKIHSCTEEFTHYANRDEGPVIRLNLNDLTYSSKRDLVYRYGIVDTVYAWMDDEWKEIIREFRLGRAGREGIHAVHLRDNINYLSMKKKAPYENTAEERHPVIVAVGTSWIKGYEKGRYLQYDAINPLLSEMNRRGQFIVADDSRLLSELKNKMGEKGFESARVIILAGENTVNTDLKEFNDGKNIVFGVDNKYLTPDSYVRIMEMLEIATKLAIDPEYTPSSPDIPMEKRGKNFWVFIPRPEPMNYEELRLVYDVQKSA